MIILVLLLLYWFKVSEKNLSYCLSFLAFISFQNLSFNLKFTLIYGKDLCDDYTLLDYIHHNS